MREFGDDHRKLGEVPPGFQRLEMEFKTDPFAVVAKILGLALAIVLAIVQLLRIV